MQKPNFSNLKDIKRDSDELDRLNNFRFQTAYNIIITFYGEEAYRKLSIQFFKKQTTDWGLFTVTNYCLDYDLAVKLLEEFLDSKKVKVEQVI